MQYKVQSSLVSWFIECLNDRTQKVVINNSFLESLSILSGVPQGCVIGSLLFIIYINDIAAEVDVSRNINFFADNTKIFSQSNTILQNSLEKTYSSLKERTLKLNPSKCEVKNTKKKNYYLYF